MKAVWGNPGKLNELQTMSSEARYPCTYIDYYISYNSNATFKSSPSKHKLKNQEYFYLLILSNMDPKPSNLPPEAIAFASKMYDAARAGQMDIFRQALPAGLPANMTNEKGDSLVCFHLFMFSLLSSPSKFNKPKISTNDYLSTQLMLAAYHGHAPLVKLLLSHGADANSLNDRGQSPLAGAVFKMESEVVEVSGFYHLIRPCHPLLY